MLLLFLQQRPKLSTSYESTNISLNSLIFINILILKVKDKKYFDQNIFIKPIYFITKEFEI
jgi:hypothetical protein